MGLNPALYWTDVSYVSYYKSNEKKKELMGHTKKLFKKILYNFKAKSLV
jgi:hypothetical protein